MTDLRALEAVRSVSEEYGIPTAQLKPCIADLLDGNATTDRHKVAFTIAVELRGLDWDASAVEFALVRWAQKIGYSPRDASRAIRNAFARMPGGGWKYRPPGLNKTGATYQETLAPICAEIGCPANCPPFANVYRGPKSETFVKFERLGWPRYLRRRRHGTAIEVYRAICELEVERDFAPGAPLFASYRQLAEKAGVHFITVGRKLPLLYDLDLLAEFERGSGDGPRARNRRASRLVRRVPLPAPPVLGVGGGRPSIPASKTGSVPQRDIGSTTLRPSSSRDLDMGSGSGAISDCNGDGPPVRVEVGEDGALVWSEPPREGEGGVLADCEALVQAGLWAWVERDDCEGME